MAQSFLVIGAGSWGTALALVLAHNGHEVMLWGKDAVCHKMQNERENKVYLPGVKFPANLNIAPDLTQAIKTAEHTLIAVPSHAFAEVIARIAPPLKHKKGIIWATKGLSHDARFLHEVASDSLGKKFPMALITGPSFAKEVAERLPTALVIASNNKAFGETMRTAFNAPYFRVYLSDDLLGAELGGAVKNVLALAVGVAQGLGFGTNTRAALMTRGLAEMMRLGEVLGAQRETLTGLSGLGDLILTCSDLKSRNLRLGVLLGQGVALKAACQQIGQVVEGIHTTKLVYELAEKHKVRMPITTEMYRILYADATPKTALAALLNSSIMSEGE
jgi:glycerol-3-phosphate dehydrogenase (NAD(P)+)